MTIKNRALIAVVFTTLSALGAATASASSEENHCYGGHVMIDGQCSLPNSHS